MSCLLRFSLFYWKTRSKFLWWWFVSAGTNTNRTIAYTYTQSLIKKHIKSCVLGFNQGNFPFLSSEIIFLSAIQSQDPNTASFSSSYSSCSITRLSFTTLHFSFPLDCFVIFSFSICFLYTFPKRIFSSLYLFLFLSQTLLIFYNPAHLPSLKWTLF